MYLEHSKHELEKCLTRRCAGGAASLLFIASSAIFCCESLFFGWCTMNSEDVAILVGVPLPLTDNTTP